MREPMRNNDLHAASGGLERAELYYMAHPGSPAAVRRPSLSIRSGTWVALLGATVQDGIAGFGNTVETALRAFDAQYLAALRPSSPQKAMLARTSPVRKRAA